MWTRIGIRLSLGFIFLALVKAAPKPDGKARKSASPSAAAESTARKAAEKSAAGGSENDEDAKENCGICKEAKGDARTLATIPVCEHEFHTECIDRWIGFNSRKCPLCRGPMLRTKRMNEDNVSVTVECPPVVEAADESMDNLLEILQSARPRSAATANRYAQLGRILAREHARTSQNAHRVERSQTQRDGGGGGAASGAAVTATRQPDVQPTAAHGTARPRERSRSQRRPGRGGFTGAVVADSHAAPRAAPAVSGANARAPSRSRSSTRPRGAHTPPR